MRLHTVGVPPTAEEAVATLVDIAQLDCPEDNIEGLPRVIAASVGRDINDIYRGNNDGVLDDVELNAKRVEASHAAVLAEAERVISLVKDIFSDDKREVQSLGVVTPYNGQVQLIKSMISNDSDLRKVFAENPVSIEVKSVDGYQGSERNVIIFSAVRSNRQAKIGFLDDWRRMNVILP